MPDQAVVTVSEIIDYNSVIAANVDIPVLADVDDFGATPLNVYRFAKQAEKAGIGCAAFDDRMPINRATAYAVPGVLPLARMIDNIHAAADARTDMVLIARCLAPTPNNSYTEMLDRAAAFAEAGADAVWLGLPSPADYVKAAAIVKKPLMAGIGRGSLYVIGRGPQSDPHRVSTGFGIGGSPIQHLRVGIVRSRSKTARDKNHLRTRVGRGMNIVDHPSQREDTRNGIGGRAVDRHAIVKGRAADAGFLSLLREAVNIERRGAKIVHIGEHRNIDVRGDDAVIVDDLGHRDDRLVRHPEKFLIGGTAADEHGLEAVDFAETRRHEIVSAGADERLRPIHQCAKA